MKNLIDKDALVAVIKKIYNEDYKFLPSDIVENIQDFKDDILRNINTLEVKDVDLNDIKTKWFPTEKQLKSLNDMLKYNIGVFDYQKFMDVNILYGELTKLLDHETDRQK